MRDPKLDNSCSSRHQNYLYLRYPPLYLAGWHPYHGQIRLYHDSWRPPWGKTCQGDDPGGINIIITGQIASGRRTCFDVIKLIIENGSVRCIISGDPICRPSHLVESSDSMRRLLEAAPQGQAGETSLTQMIRSTSTLKDAIVASFLSQTRAAAS